MNKTQQDQLDEIFNEWLLRGKIPTESHAAVWDLAVAATLKVMSA